jgi:lantibiotic modifying enzyme
MTFSAAEWADLNRRARFLQERLGEEGAAAEVPPTGSVLRGRWLDALGSERALARRLAALRAGGAGGARALDRQRMEEILALSVLESAEQRRMAVGDLPLPPLGEILLPFACAARRRLRGNEALGAMLSDEILDGACQVLLHRLVHFAAAALYLEYRLFAGTSAMAAYVPPGSGEGLAAFAARMKGDGLKAFLMEYPVLTRWLLEACRQYEDMLAEMPALAPSLAGRRIERLDVFLSDLHEGKSVFAVELEDGSAWHVKPRAGEIEEWLGRNVAGLDLAMPTAFRAGAYTVAETVRPAACRDAAEVRRFFERAGRWLCVFRHLHACDMHCANVVAAGAFPMPVDAETLLQPEVPWHVGVPHPLVRTDILPAPGSGETSPDYSALGRTEGALMPHVVRTAVATNDGLRLSAEACRLPAHPSLPTLDGRTQRAADFVDEIRVGYAAGYAALKARRGALLESPDGLKALAGLRTRYVFRHTGTYNQLQARLLHPECLRSGDVAGVELERLAARAWREDGGDARVAALAAAEIAALGRMDIPLFLSAADGCTIHGADGEALAAYAGPTPLDRARSALEAMSDVHLAEELEIVSACLARHE